MQDLCVNKRVTGSYKTVNINPYCLEELAAKCSESFFIAKGLCISLFSTYLPQALRL